MNTKQIIKNKIINYLDEPAPFPLPYPEDYGSFKEAFTWGRKTINQSAIWSFTSHLLFHILPASCFGIYGDWRPYNAWAETCEQIIIPHLQGKPHPRLTLEFLKTEFYRF
jgi:hypothetical protein